MPQATGLGFLGLSVYAFCVPSKLLGMSTTLSLSALLCNIFRTGTLGCLVRQVVTMQQFMWQ